MVILVSDQSTIADRPPPPVSRRALVRLLGALTQSIRDRYEAAHDDGRPLLGGHRGNPADHPENTLRSFRSAIAVGCDLIECDVHLSSDGRLVVIHDHTLERTTSGTGLVRDHTAAELRKLDAGQGEKIPLLQEVIELALGKVGLVIELKHAPIQYPGIEDKLLAMLRQLGAVQECAVISFHHPSIFALRQMEPNLQLGILEGSRPMQPARMLREAGADVYSPHWGAADPQLVSEVHAAGGAQDLDIGDVLRSAQRCEGDAAIIQPEYRVAAQRHAPRDPAGDCHWLHAFHQVRHSSSRWAA